MPTAVLSTPAELLTRVPVTTLMKQGELRLSGNRLSFTTLTGEVILDAPIEEIHSVVPVEPAVIPSRAALVGGFINSIAVGYPLVAQVIFRPVNTARNQIARERSINS